MNDRIRQLAKQAGWSGFEALDERNEKFAELIIKECLDTMICADLTDLDDAYPEDVMYAVYDQTKKHFEVKD